MQPFVLQLFNPSTSQTTELTPSHHRPIAHNEIVLLAHENPQDLLQLQKAWQKDFPGNSQTLITQRDILLKADWQRRRLAAAFEELQLDLAFTGLPLHQWLRPVRKRFDTMHQTHSRAERDFTHALKSLQSVSSSAQPLAKEAPPPALPLEITGTYIYQSVEVSVVEGKTRTKVDLDAEYWLTHPISCYTVGYCRQFRFVNLFVPPEYAYALEHNGVTHAPARGVFLYYSIEEFRRLCQLELDTGSEHLLDEGIRMNTGYLI